MFKKKIFILVIILIFSNFSFSEQIIRTSNNNNPIEIFAEEGIEWHKNKQKYIAKGDAQAKKGDLIVKSEVLEADYKKSENSENEITFLKAKGKVYIENKKAKILGGDFATYNLEKEYFKVSGKKLKLISDVDELTSNSKMEFWNIENIAIATGKAIAKKKSKYTIYAEKLVWHLDLDNNNEYQVKKILAYDNVIIESNSEIAYSDKALYNESKEICKLFGNVKLKKDGNFLTGEYAEMNLSNGISKLLPYPKNQKKKKKVRALIKKNNEE